MSSHVCFSVPRKAGEETFISRGAAGRPAGQFSPAPPCGSTKASSASVPGIGPPGGVGIARGGGAGWGDAGELLISLSPKSH